MAFDGLAIGGTPAIPTNVAPLAGPLPINDDVVIPDAGDEGMVGAIEDAAEVAVTVGLQALSVVKTPVNVAGAMVEALKEVVPGAKLLGDWQVAQVMAVKEAIAFLPKSIIPWYHGVTIRIEPRGSRHEEEEEKTAEQRKLIVAEVAKREIRIKEEAFGLPEIGGVPGFRLALVGELGRLGAAKPANVQEFARLSGWTQTVRGADGRLVEPPRPTTGAVPGEAPAAPTRGLGDPQGPVVPMWRPEAPTANRGAARPAGTQGLSPSETARLRPGAADPRRAPGTAPLGDTGALPADPRLAGRPGQAPAGRQDAAGGRADGPNARNDGPAGRAEGPNGRAEAPNGRLAGPTRPGEAPTRPGEAPTRPGEAPTRPGEGPARAGEAPPRPGEAPARPGEPAARRGDASARGAAAPARPGEAPSRGDQPVAGRGPDAGRQPDGAPAPGARAAAGPTGTAAPAGQPGARGPEAAPGPDHEPGQPVAPGATGHDHPTAGEVPAGQAFHAADHPAGGAVPGAGPVIAGADPATTGLAIPGEPAATGFTAAPDAGAEAPVDASGSTAAPGDPVDAPPTSRGPAAPAAPPAAPTRQGPGAPARTAGEPTGRPGSGPASGPLAPPPGAGGRSPAGPLGRGPAEPLAGPVARGATDPLAGPNARGGGEAFGARALGPARGATPAGTPTQARGEAGGLRGEPTTGRGEPGALRGEPGSLRGEPGALRGEPAARPGAPARRGELSGPFGAASAPAARGADARPGAPTRAGGTTPLPADARAADPRRGPDGGPRGATDGPRAMPGPARPGAVRGGAAAPGPAERIEGGSRVQLANQQVLEFHHDAGAGFVGGPHAELDPRADFGESLKAFLFKPEALLAKAPSKFLFLNAETRQFTAAQVQAMAKAAGVDLGKVVTDLLVSGRASQATISRMCEHHGLAADAVALRAKDQQVLARGANVEGLVGRLALDLGANGPATAKAVREAEALSAAFEKLAARLPMTKDPARAGMATGSGVFAWIASRAAKAGEDRLSRVDAELGEIRAQFQRLPLAAQLKVDPRLAMGAGWFRFSPEERQLLANPQAVQGLVARATERVDEVGYIPQRLNATEKRQLATRTVIEALFDPSAAGAAFRAKLGVPDGRAGATGGGARKPDLPGDPLAALKDLPARNGEATLALLDDGQRKALGDKRAAAAIKAALADPALGEALATLRRGATGSEEIRTAVLKYALEQGRKDVDLVAAVKGAVEAVKAEKAKFQKSLDGGSLELALTEVNRQVQENNVEFVQKFVADSPAALEEALGAWVWQGLSESEKKLLEDPDYRRHLVADAQTLRATGASLAEEARQFRIETENIQQTLDFLVRPDQTFRKEFATDPVGALMRRGIYPHLPDPIKLALAEGEKITQIQQLTKAVEQTLQPIIQRQIGHQKQLENLRAAIKTVNAGNYKPILGILDLGEAEMNRAVRSTLTSAMSHGDKEIRGGIVSFI